MQFSPRQLVGAAVVLLCLTAGGVALRAHDTATLDSAQKAADSARRALVQANAHAAAADSVASAADASAQHAVAAEHMATQHADSAARTLATMRERYRVVTVTVPDTCRPIQAAADSALASADSVAASLHAALSAADDRATALQTGLDTTRAALATLRVAAVQSVAATAALEHAARPGLFHRMLKAALPRVGVGVGAGIDTHGVPNAVTGLTIGWSF